MFAPLFLGFDLSTQALKASAISVGSDQVLVSATVSFDKDLPHHNTSNGSIVSLAGDGEITTPVALFLDAIDLVMQRLKDAGLEFGRVLAVGGAAQQHGSVYWSPSATSLLANLDPSKSLTAQLAADAFSLPNAPIWQDFSTARECRIIEAAVGGPQALSDLTGSRAYERFTGSQILKVASRTPDVYARTAHISLISSFLTSLFLGKVAPVEIADASGMNLMNVHTCKYDEQLLDICSGGTGNGPELREKLGGEPVMGGTNMGRVSGWWIERFGFNSDCLVTPFTGDNPSSIVMLSSPGDAILSFGTSTTLLVSIPPSNEPPSCTTTSHILSHPTTAGGSIAMLCYKNGGLTREAVRDEHASRSWDEFNTLLTSTPPGNSSKFGFYFTLREIIPDGVYGEFFFDHTKTIQSQDLTQAEHTRAVVESQLMSIKTRLQAILHGNGGVKRCIVTGGSSTNTAMQQVCADVLGLPVYVAEASGSATVGGALLARWGWYRATGSTKGLDHAQDWQGRREEIPLEATREGGGVRVKLVAEPHPEAVEVYNLLVHAYQQNEEEVVRVCRARDLAATSKLVSIATKPAIGLWRSILGVFGLLLD
ncbi:FGGY-family carbohydrate kinase [Rhizoctonia solani]|uniref:Xylulose kinase n=1 Tax=Rhizoctonia solani TaxID=456999 RepID=A0A8H7HFP0_9AGAM|nr:FGGY-family carbohydrate kinase [Rhizoctonia solani]KAF8686749.1 Actin-like ATPase protein [Rhizoctonia solani]QRW17221.1 FGGY-family carbohydrate kinase [Rhizoctonia solani]